MFNVKVGLLISIIVILNGSNVTPVEAAGTVQNDIARVEQNLLPAVILAGEPAFGLEDRMAHYKVPGISITVFQDFKILWSKQYGLADAELGTPVTPTTQFNVGSLSKGVASLAVLSLVDEGLVKLDEDVNRQLTSWQIPDNDFMRESGVTPRLLMNHSGGAIFSPGVSYPPGNPPTLLQVLEGAPPANTRPVTIDRVPGTQFQYSNAGYAILQQLVMDASGNSFEAFSQERIFGPLQMTHSSFEQALSEGVTGKPSAGHRADGSAGDIKRYVYPIMAAGGLWSTTEDYARFVIELQRSYRGEGGQLIPRGLAVEMLSPGPAKQYGLGVFMRENNGEVPYFGHMGDNRGFFSGYLAHMTKGYGAVVFTNSQVGVQLIREIMQSIGSVYGWEDYLPATRVVVPVDDETLESHVGSYKSGPDSAFRIEMQGGQLMLDKFGGVRLFHVGGGEFVTKFRKGSLQFGGTADGMSATAVFNFADELGRFIQGAIESRRIQPGTKLPHQLLETGRYEEALEAYQGIKQASPEEQSVAENRLNGMGYRYLGQGMPDVAISTFKVNLELYPDSWNCYDSIGEAYMQNGEKELAIHNFKRSLELNPNNQNGKRLLKQLQGEG